MNKTMILKRLREYGLSAYESKSYLSLLEKNALTVAEVAKIAGIPRPSAYEALEKLMMKGLCLARSGNTKMYSASDPDLLREKFHIQIDEAMSNENENFDKKEADIIARFEKEKNKKLLELRNEKEKTAQKRKSAKENIISIVKELKPYYEQSRNNNNPLDYISVLKDPHQIHRKFVELFSKAQKEVLVFCKPPFAYSTEKEWDEQKQVQIEATERGVVVRGIIEMPPENQVKEFFNRQSGKSFANTNDECRMVDELPIKLNIYDNRACFFTLVDPIKDRTSLTMLVAEHEALTLSFRMLFESVWEKAKNYYIYKGKKYNLYEPNSEDGLHSYKRKSVTKLL